MCCIKMIKLFVWVTEKEKELDKFGGICVKNIIDN